MWMNAINEWVWIQVSECNASECEPMNELESQHSAPELSSPKKWWVNASLWTIWAVLSVWTSRQDSQYDRFRFPLFPYILNARTARSPTQHGSFDEVRGRCVILPFSPSPAKSYWLVCARTACWLLNKKSKLKLKHTQKQMIYAQTKSKNEHNKQFWQI